MRNAELRQQVESAKKRGTEMSFDLEREVKDKDNAIAGLEQALQDVQLELQDHKRKVSS